MPSLKLHTISIKPIALDGIIVYDRKRPKGRIPQQLNKISVVASFSRNRTTETTLPSRPIIPSKNDRVTVQRNRGGLRYRTLWDNTRKDESIRSILDDDDLGNILLETNLHPTIKYGMNTFETKTYEVVIGLRRGDNTIVLAVSVFNVNGPTKGEIDMDLPLFPMESEDMDEHSSHSKSSNRGEVRNMERVYFDEDEARKYAVAQNAILKVKIEILDSKSK